MGERDSRGRGKKEFFVSLIINWIIEPLQPEIVIIKDFGN